MHSRHALEIRSDLAIAAAFGGSWTFASRARSPLRGFSSYSDAHGTNREGDHERIMSNAGVDHYMAVLALASMAPWLRAGLEVYQEPDRSHIRDGQDAVYRSPAQNRCWPAVERMKLTTRSLVLVTA